MKLPALPKASSGILKSVLAANTLAYLAIRLLGDRSTELEVQRPAKPGEKVTYIIGGNCAQARKTGAFLFDELQGGILTCNYRMTGWNPNEMARALLNDMNFGKGEDIAQKQLVAISCGDMVARRLDGLVMNLEIVSINPVPSPEALRRHIRRGLRVVAPVLQLAAIPLGTLSFLPVIPASGSRYSLALLADQWWHLAYGRSPHHAENTRRILLSMNRQETFLDNRVLRTQLFREIPVTWVDAPHADTIRNAKKYLKAFKAMMAETSP